MKSSLPVFLVCLLTLFVAKEWLIQPSSANSAVLPFQGRLTDVGGNLIADGVRVVQFKIYDAPVGGRPLWNGEIHRLSVNGGLVNTLLGTKSDLSGVDFSEALYLELTIDSNEDGLITQVDPPLLPRQRILPSVFAIESGNSRTLNGHDWNVLLDDPDPTVGRLRSSFYADRSISFDKIVSDEGESSRGIQSDQIAEGAVGASEIEDGSVGETELNADLLNRLGLGLMPPGVIVPFAGSREKVPQGWELCDGRALDKDGDAGAYARLFEAVGTAWGNGTTGQGAIVDVTDFNLPDLRGRFLRGVAHELDLDPDKDTRSAAQEGGNPGNLVGSSQDDQFESHSHFVGRRGADGDGQRKQRPLSWSDWEIYNDPLHTGNTGGAETRPVNAYVNYIIKI